MGIHIDLDGAWPTELLRGFPHLDITPLDVPALDLREWGAKLRFCALNKEVETFYQEIKAHLNSPFLLYGSGDFHHLTALWLRKVEDPITVISFDNHPDWDIRPPRWCCGNWINRALELPQVQHVAVWGCGNFECWGWHRLTGNHADVKKNKLEVHAWADQRSKKDQAHSQAILQGTWRQKFKKWATEFNRTLVYVTVDMDCLVRSDAITNWENGFFKVEDIVWALETLKYAGAIIIAGDVCGAFSPAHYARRTQRFAAKFDHPKLKQISESTAAYTNIRSLEQIWPVLTNTAVAMPRD